ncbi:uncharacterized protein UMAG_00187 [Mycosarcoma maydis]|uniref:Secreted protein n=1 Tax=Mycosarcoma maydis TaxID=5270 RepID=A0A0D1CFG9_MYCMD|nr:uncharacterized protein UMAG_00187 [Ustilago maydis 521]KIS71752.1 hypothetical protein UMAG_00187 [Ustilago maydis 521]|eukprot:XP_011386127.1 hypothetical protein UMAG_00187 [Ustilago maydis 521]
MNSNSLFVLLLMSQGLGMQQLSSRLQDPRCKAEQMRNMSSAPRSDTTSSTRMSAPRFWVWLDLVPPPVEGAAYVFALRRAPSLSSDIFKAATRRYLFVAAAAQLKQTSAA